MKSPRNKKFSPTTTATLPGGGKPAWRRRALLGAVPSAAAAPWILSACARSRSTAASSARHEVVILGGGLAGLTAARKLRRAGRDVVLLEARERSGGRVLSFHGSRGPTEAGGTEVGGSYTRFLDLCREFGIGLKPSSVIRNYTLHIRGSLLPEQAWPDSAANRLAGELRKILPARLFSHSIGSLLQGGDLSPESRADRDVSVAAKLRSLGLSPEALRLIDANFNANGLETISWSYIWNKLLRWRAAADTKVYQVDGGASRLPDALAAEQEELLMLNRRATDISVDRRGVAVRCEDGSSMRGKLLICTLPFSVLRTLRLSAPLSAPMTAAIRGLSYTPVTRAFMVPRSPYWNEDGLPPSMWTDTPLGRVFALPVDAENIDYIVVFSMGRNALLLDRMIADDRQSPLRLLESIRPSAKGKLELEEIVSWGADPFSLGAFSYHPPGGLGQYTGGAAVAEGRMLFAGEHTNPSVPGMEGAIVSGERAADKALKLLG